MSEILRLVIAGGVGAGKSTFIRTVSEIDVVDTDRVATDNVAQLKQKTTVAFDFGRVHCGEGTVLHLYGIPGQERFDFIWDVLFAKAHAYVLLVAAHRPEDFQAARRIISFVNHRVCLPMVVGITHCDLPNAWEEEDIAVALGFAHGAERPRMLRVNANETAGVIETLVSLLEVMMHEPQPTSPATVLAEEEAPLAGYAQSARLFALELPLHNG